MTVREVDALRAKRGPSATSEPTHTCFSRAPLFRLGILMPFGEPASASPPGHRTSESGRRPFHSSVPASPRPSCRKGKSMPDQATDERSRPPEPLFHFLRIRCSTSRNPCSTSSGFRVPLPPEYACMPKRGGADEIPVIAEGAPALRWHERWKATADIVQWVSRPGDLQDHRAGWRFHHRSV